MKNKSWLVNLILIVILFFIALYGFMYFQPVLFEDISHHHHQHAHSSENKAQDFEKGPHQGRLLQENQFQVEVTIFEPEGVPPRFRIYFYDQGAPINPQDVKYAMQLKRINHQENVSFKIENNYLESIVEASEPHSFKVFISAVFCGQTYQWEYESYEGRLELDAQTVKANGIKIEKAGPIDLAIKLSALGKAVPNEELTTYISPRFAGIVRSVHKKLGDDVRKGEILAVIESNESLKNYELRSEINGTVIKKDITLGMNLSGQEHVFVISDLSSLWADFAIYRQDLAQVKVGDPIEITSLDGSLRQPSTISYISPVGNEATQSTAARALLPNPDRAFKPGLFLAGEITVEQVFIPVAVKKSALQTFREWNVVFIALGNLFEVAPVKLGRSNREFIEIKAGLSAGDEYVSENSFILKADLEKSGATHEH